MEDSGSKMYYSWDARLVVSLGTQPELVNWIPQASQFQIFRVLDFTMMFCLTDVLTSYANLIKCGSKLWETRFGRKKKKKKEKSRRASCDTF